MAVAHPIDPDPPGLPSAWWDEFEDPPGYRAEVIRGELVLSPSPGRVHQRALGRLYRLLDDACLDDHEAVPDIEWRLDVGGVVAQAPRPDLVVVRRGNEPIVEPPLLAVEILSPSDHRLLEDVRQTRLQGKQLDYAGNGLKYLLLFSPAGPWAQLLVPHTGGWVEVISAEGDEEFLSEQPFTFGFRPSKIIQP